MLNLQTAKPGWVRQGCVLDLDFANNRYWGGYVSQGNGTSSTDRPRSILTNGSNAAAGVNYSLAGDGLYYPQKTAASNRILPGIGLYSEVDSSNTCLWSRDLTQSGTWINTTCTVAKNQTGIDGLANVASSLTATAPLGHILQTPASSTSRIRFFSCFMKRLVGSGAVSLTLDGSSYTDVSGSINSNTYTRVFITATSANPIVGFQIATSGDSVAIDFCQHEFASGVLVLPPVPTSPMFTTSTAVTRVNGGAGEEAFCNNPSVPAGYNDGWRWIDYMTKATTSFIWEGAGNSAPGTIGLLTGTDQGAYFITGGINGDTVKGASGGVAGIANLNKIAYSRGGALERACVNGNAINSTATPFNNSPAATHGGIGNRGAGDESINGYCKRVTYFMRELTDGEMLEYTR